MAMVVGVSAHSIFGLKFITPHEVAVFTVVETTMAELAPTIQLEQVSRPLLLHLAEHSLRMGVRRYNKAQLAQIVFDAWDDITGRLAPYVNGAEMQTVHDFFHLNPQAGNFPLCLVEGSGVYPSGGLIVSTVLGLHMHKVCCFAGEDNLALCKRTPPILQTASRKITLLRVIPTMTCQVGVVRVNWKCYFDRRGQAK